MTIGINSLFSGDHGRKMIKESIAQDREAKKITEMVEDPIASSRAEMEKVSVPGGGSQDIGTEYATSDFPTHAPNDQEQDLDAGPNTTKAPATDEMVDLPTQAHKDAMSILKQQTAMLDKQTMFDDPADETVGVIAPPDTEGDMEHEDDDYETMMPGAMPYGECLRNAGGILDQLGEGREDYEYKTATGYEGRDYDADYEYGEEPAPYEGGWEYIGEDPPPSWWTKAKRGLSSEFGVGNEALAKKAWAAGGRHINFQTWMKRNKFRRKRVATPDPHSMPREESLSAGDILDRLAEASGGRVASRRQHFLLNVKNKGATGSTDPVISAAAAEYGNPATDDEKPEDYLVNPDSNEYPDHYPEMPVGHGGQVKMMGAPKSPVASESAAVASAVQLITEGNDPDDVARLLLGS